MTGWRSVRKMVYGVLMIWLFSVPLLGGMYPPRHFVFEDYAVVVIVGMSACLVVPPPGVTWRYSAVVLYALLSGWPFVVTRVQLRYGTALRLATMYGNATSSPRRIMVPLGGMLLLLMCVAVASAFLGTIARRYLGGYRCK